MKPTGTLKHFVLAFVIALIMYFIAYTFIENRRTHNGPWEVTFSQSDTGIPTLIVNQPSLKISNLKLTFPAQHCAPTNQVLRFSQPQNVPFDVPFGQCLFEDTTFQPGTIVFNLFGHEVQLIPRALTVDRKEYPWQSETTMELNKGAILAKPGKR